MSPRHGVLLGSLMALATPMRPLLPQTNGSVTIVGGGTTDARGVRSNALTIAPGVAVRVGLRSSAWVGASGTAFENNAWSAGANGALATRTRTLGGAALTLTAGGGVAFTSYDATFVTGDAISAAEYTWRTLTIYGGAHGTVGVTAVPDANRLPHVPWVASLTSVTRSSIAPVYGAQMRVVATPQSGLAIWVREDPMRVAGVRVRDRTAGVTYANRMLTLAGNLGARRAADERTDFAGASASLALTPAWSVDVAAGRYPSNRLTGAAAGRYVSAGITARFGARGAAPLPAPAGVSRPPTGVTRLSIRARDASNVELAGDWNDWQPVAAQRAANGVWYADLALPPGEYRYSFRINGTEWRVPIETAAVNDGFGGKSAYVTVRGAEPTK